MNSRDLDAFAELVRRAMPAGVDAASRLEEVGQLAQKRAPQLPPGHERNVERDVALVAIDAARRLRS